MTEITIENGLAVVVPCYNAGGRLRPVLKGVLRHTQQVVVVDDGSTDVAIENVRDLPVNIVTFECNRGKGHALIEGFRTALGNSGVHAVAVVDADGQHDPAELPRLFAAMAEHDADLVIGARVFDKAQVPWASWLGNKLTVVLTAALLHKWLADTQSGYRLHSRRFLEDVIQTVPGGRYDTEMEILVRAVRGGYRVVSVPIETIYERGNRSSHFNKLRDSYLVYRRLFRAAFGRVSR